MTQIAERAVTDQAPTAIIAGAIPLIDVAGHLDGDASSSRKAATQLRWAFENIGFYYLLGHGVPQSLIDRTYEEAARFHAQPMARKLALKVNEHNIGYLPISNAASSQAAAQGRKPSQNEAYFLRRERALDDPAVIANQRFHGLNQWPDDLPGFHATTLEYIRALEALCRHCRRTVCRACPSCCRADAGSTRPASRAPMSSTAATSYIAGPTSGFCRRRIGRATFRTRCAMQSRSSATPDHDTLIECLPSCRSADQPAKYPPIRFGDYALWFARKSYEHMANELALSDVVVAPGPAPPGDGEVDALAYKIALGAPHHGEDLSC